MASRGSFIKHPAFALAAFVVLFLAVLAIGCGSTGTGSATTGSTVATDSTSTTLSGKIDKTKFTGAWRALVAINSATSVGVTYPNFGPLLSTLLAEVDLIPKDGLSAKEQAAILKMADIVQNYKDSYDAWKTSIDAPSGGSAKASAKALLQTKWAAADAVMEELRPDLAP